MDQDRVYIAIDLKSFYASAECMERGLDPLDTNLVVADESRTEKTICLAVTPSLKAYGIPGRARLFEVVQKVSEINALRAYKAPGRTFTGKSYSAAVLAADPSLELDYIVAKPRMALYMDISTKIFGIYNHYVAPEDIHVYSVDEVFMDVTSYLNLYHVSPRDLARTMIRDVMHATGITATAGIGTNLYLAKVAMDIVAKKIPADEDGVRIAELDQMSYRKLLWDHRPLTDFWRVGSGYSSKLEKHGLYTMGDIARCSLGRDSDYYNEDLLYHLFGINAELLIDHAWGYEPVGIKEIKGCTPKEHSLSIGQVLSEPYSYEKGRLIVKEMTDLLVLDLVSKRLITDQMVLNIGYDIDNLTDPARRKAYHGPVVKDHYGRLVPKGSHGSINLMTETSSTEIIMNAIVELYESVADPNLLIRRVNVVANHVKPESARKNEVVYEQLDLFTDYALLERQRKEEQKKRERERALQEAVLDLKSKYGKNTVLKGMNLEEGATTRIRNGQIGGHSAGEEQPKDE